MKTSSIYTFDITANGVYRLPVAGTLFKLLLSTGAVNVRSDNIDLKSLITGQGMMNTPFNYLTFTDVSGASNTLRIVVADSEFIDGMTGSMTITANKNTVSAAFANTAATVTNASAQLLAASTTRQYLMIQNKDASGNIYVNFGAAATVANGIKIPPGGNYELNNIVSTQAIFAIGDIASNANVLTVVG